MPKFWNVLLFERYQIICIRIHTYNIKPIPYFTNYMSHNYYVVENTQ